MWTTSDFAGQVVKQPDAHGESVSRAGVNKGGEMIGEGKGKNRTNVVTK